MIESTDSPAPISLLEPLLLGLVEGVTEFLPISSTGHLILVGDWLDFGSDEGRMFEVLIQLGAALAVCWLYRMKFGRLWQGLFSGSRTHRRFAAAVAVALLPAAAAGALLIGVIKSVLFSPVVVALALIGGGWIILRVEQDLARSSAGTVEEVTLRQAVIVGLAQCVAMIPGTSRSGATIVAGLVSGMSRQVATEFSFFLAVPMMVGASLYDAWHHHHLLQDEDLSAIAIGFVAAFGSALLVVKALVRFVATHSFRPFAYYRIALGTVLLIHFALAG